MIAMFDSGLGGLSVWRAVTRALPQWPVSYFADQAYLPYGEKTREQLTERSLRIGRFLADQGAAILIVPCNTATSAAVDAMRQALPLPIIGIEPAVKPAAAASRTGRIAVLATEFTLKSARFRSLLQRHAGKVEVLPRPGTGWVEQVESGDLDSAQARDTVRQVIEPLLTENVDHIVLGCTHYPFLAPLIREIAGPDVILDDPADAIARRAVALLAGKMPAQPHDYRFYTTANPADMSDVLPVLIGQPYPVQQAGI
ncbi:MULTISPECIES: glutamate racemase [unclassified Paludibacterium]|uniref:glutamate racemase n=1 Tax=unclassified Paludibacterium TaxID=2618429 RepID=UPI001C05CBFB|nr:glutamate racemase [Paludibacterium sp. B53371]BEV73744.1 glutamate racemase [Paludibacterium sp. THUN1379]